MSNGMKEQNNIERILSLTEVPSGAKCILDSIRPIANSNPEKRPKRGRGRGIGRKRHGREKIHGHQWQTLQRLLDLGLTKGCSFKVIQGSNRGPVLLEIRGTRIAIGQSLARRLLVRRIEQDYDD